MTSSTGLLGRKRACRTKRRLPTQPYPRRGIDSPITPMIMSTQPVVCRLKTEVVARTGKAMIAPRAITASPVPVFMRILPLCERPGRSSRRCRQRGGRGLFGRIDQPASQVGQSPGQEPGDVHLRDAEPVADLGLGEVAVEAHHQDALLT